MAEFTFTAMDGKIKITKTTGGDELYYYRDELTAQVISGEMQVRARGQFSNAITTGGVADYSPTAADVETLAEDYNTIFFTSGNGGGSSDESKDFTIDPAGRQRISPVLSLGDYRFSSGTNPDAFYSEDINGGAGAWNSLAQPYYSLLVSDDEDRHVLQTAQWHPYLTGKPQLVELTFIGFDSETDVTKRIGYFSSDDTTPFDTVLDGIYLESTGTGYSLNVYRAGNITASIANDAWDDPLDGTGGSGFTIDWSGFNVFAFDFLWLGGSAIRFAFKNGGDWVVFHTYEHAGQGFSDVLIASPAQPVRATITSTGGAGDFSFVCSNVSSEGLLSSIGMPRFISNTDTTHIDANTIGTKYAVCGIRLDATNSKGIAAVIHSLSVEASTNDDFKWELHINPTIDGTPVWDTVGNSLTERGEGDTTGNPSTTTVSADGIIMKGGYVQGNSTIELDVDDERRIGWTIDGTPEELWLIVQPITSNLDVRGGMHYIEIG